MTRLASRPVWPLEVFRCWFFLVALLVTSTAVTPARAQTSATPAGSTLAGRVTDSAGQPILAVSVAVTELKRGAITDADGRYEIPSLPRGTYHVSFQRLGFAPVVRHFAFGPGTTTLDVTLAVSVVEIPGTQVSATANPSMALTSPQPVSVLEGPALRQSVKATLGATLEGLPGLRSWSTGSGIGKPMIRGLRSDRVVIASEDLRIDNQGWGDEHGPQVESADVGRVEVLRGPASVLYGSDALGGVVHVIPRPVPVAFGRSPFLGGRMFGAYGSVDKNGEGGLSLEGAAQGLGFRTSWSGRKSGDVDTPDGELFNSGNESTSGSGAAALRGTWGSVSGSYTRRDERVEIHEDPAEDPTATPYQKIADDLGRFSVLLPVGGESRFEMNLGVEQNRRREFESNDDPAVAVGLLSKTYNGVVHFHHAPLGQLEGLVGVSAQSTRFTKFGEESLIPASTGDDFAVFAFEETHTGPWNFAFGARYDHRSLEVEDDADLGVAAQTRDWDAVTGNLGILFRIAEPVALVANVGRGFRAPSNFDLFANGVHEGTIAFERGNPNLDVETSLNGDVAVRIQGSRARAEIGGFVNEIENFIYTRPTGTFDVDSGLEIFDAVQGDARLTGFELAADYHPERHIHLSASSDFVRGDNTDTDTPLPWIPPFRALYGVRLEPDAKGWAHDLYVGIRGESVAKQNRLDPFDSTVPEYTLAHLEAGLTIPAGERSVAFDLGVNNVFDREHRDFLSRFKTYALAPGRSVTVRLTTQF